MGKTAVRRWFLDAADSSSSRSWKSSAFSKEKHQQIQYLWDRCNQPRVIMWKLMFLLGCTVWVQTTKNVKLKAGFTARATMKQPRKLWRISLTVCLKVAGIMSTPNQSTQAPLMSQLANPPSFIMVVHEQKSGKPKGYRRSSSGFWMIINLHSGSHSIIHCTSWCVVCINYVSSKVSFNPWRHSNQLRSTIINCSPYTQLINNYIQP